MEKRIKTKVDEHLAKMKEDIKKYVVEHTDNAEQFNSLLK